MNVYHYINICADTYLIYTYYAHWTLYSLLIYTLFGCRQIALPRWQRLPEEIFMLTYFRDTYAYTYIHTYIYMGTLCGTSIHIGTYICMYIKNIFFNLYYFMHKVFLQLIHCSYIVILFSLAFIIMLIFVFRHFLLLFTNVGGALVEF